MLCEGLYAYLSTHAVVGPMIVTGSRVRMHPLMIPQHVPTDPDILPCLVYMQVGRVEGRTFCATDTVGASIIQIDSCARKYVGAKALASAVRAALVDHSGLMGATQVDTVALESEVDGVDTDPGIYRVTQSFLIWHH